MLQTHARQPDTSPDATASPHLPNHVSRWLPNAPPAGVSHAQPAISTPNDTHEQEADRVAEQVLRMPEPRRQHLQEQLPLAGAGAGVHVESLAPSSVHKVLRSPGQPLDPWTRSFMEPRFGRDFSRVRIHTDAEAAQSAGGLLASAYTVGDDIVFAKGRYAPSTSEGSRLLAHELAHVVQDAGRPATLRRKPDPKLSEAQLRVQIVDALEAIKTRALDAVTSAIARGDRAFLEGLKLTSRQVDDLLNRTSRFNTEFGTALERQIEQYVRANPDLGSYVKKGPSTVARRVGKPDWIIETPSSRIPVELTTAEQLEKKLKMWRTQHPKGQAKAYVEKGLNLTYEIPSDIKAPKPPGAGVPVETPPVSIPGVAQAGTRMTALRAAGRFLAREAPGLALQAAFMLLFPPGVHINNDKAEELGRTKLEPAIKTALEKQGPAFEKLLANDASRLVYANVTARLEYAVGANQHGDLLVTLKDMSFVGMTITNDDIVREDPRFQAGTGGATKQITYSFVLYEPESVIREREAAKADQEYAQWVRDQPNYKKWVRAQQEYEACLQQHGTGFTPPAAGAEAASEYNPEAGPCIPPRMEPMEGP